MSVGLVGVFGASGAARRVVEAASGLRRCNTIWCAIAGDEGVRGVETGAVLGARGHACIAHVARDGASRLGSVTPHQSITARGSSGAVSLALVGRFTNGLDLREQLKSEGSLFRSDDDAELVLHLMARSSQETFVNSLVEALYRVEGPFSVVLLTDEQLVAVRGPWGFAPLWLGRVGDARLVATETSAIVAAGGRVEREVGAGEMVILDASGVQSIRPFPARPLKVCGLESLRFAQPDALVSGGSAAYSVRQSMGVRLAQRWPVHGDVVVGIPQAGRPAALGFAHASGLPYEELLIDSVDTVWSQGRPTSQERDPASVVRFRAVAGQLRGRRVVVVDDILRTGATARAAVRCLRDAGAAEVHLRVASQPLRSACPYGLSVAPRGDLLARTLSGEEMRAYLGADSLGVVPLDDGDAGHGSGPSRHCTACMTGDHPIEPAGHVVDPQVPLFRGAPTGAE